MVGKSKSKESLARNIAYFALFSRFILADSIEKCNFAVQIFIEKCSF